VLNGTQKLFTPTVGDSITRAHLVLRLWVV